MKTVSVASASLLALTALWGTAASAAATGTVVFSQPTGTVAGNVSIPAYLTVSLDAASSAIQTDASGNVISGVTNADLIAAGIDPALVASSDVNNSFSCSGTFTAVCTGGPPYDFSFAFGDGSLTFPANLDIEPGTSTQFLFGTFTPTGGSAPAGSYIFYDASIYAQYYDAAGNHLGDVQFFDTCAAQDASCAFQRDVTAAAAAVPEPASWALMLSGFGLMGGALRRQRKAKVSFG
jgi:hypothetical protein